MNQEVIGYTRKLLGFPRNLLVFAMNRAYKVVRIYAKSPYTDLPEKNHQKMVCISLKKKSVFWLRGPHDLRVRNSFLDEGESFPPQKSAFLG